MACHFFYILLVHQEYYVLALGIIMIMGPLTTPPKIYIIMGPLAGKLKTVVEDAHSRL